MSSTSGHRSKPPDASHARGPTAEQTKAAPSTGRRLDAAARDHAVLAAALDPIITMDAHGTILSVSDSVMRVFGWSPHELVGRNVGILMPEPHRSAHDGYLEAYRRTQRTTILGRTREFEAVRKNGERFPIELSVSKVDGSEGADALFVGILRDISQRTRAEREVRLIRDLALAIAGAASVSDAMVEALRRICLETGWDYGEAWLVAPERGCLVDGNVWAQPDSGLDAIEIQSSAREFHRGIGLPGRIWTSSRPMWVHDLQAIPESELGCRDGVRAAGLRAACGVPVPFQQEVVAVLVFFLRRPREQDERELDLVRAAVAPLGSVIAGKRTLDALRDSEQRLRFALTAAGGGSWDWDVATETASWSEALDNVVGIAPGTHLSTAESLTLIDDRDRSRVIAAIDEAMSRKRDFQCEFRIRHPSHGERWLAAHGRLVLGPTGEPARLHGIALDISARKEAEAVLRRQRERLEWEMAERTRELEASRDKLRIADRLASIGTLAAGLGHDMNNVLLPVRAHLNALDAATAGAGGSRSVRGHVDKIRKSVAYLQQLADGLHFLAMDPDKELEPGESTDLAAWWSRTGALISKAVPRQVTVHARFPTELPAVAVAPSGLTQAVLNLVVNAGEAIAARPEPGHGRVQITATAGTDRSVVRLCVADNGVGMTDEVKRRAFELFYTTKPRGLGTGLGLALVQKVVRQAGGEVELHSEVGRGTTISMLLPAVRRSRSRTRGRTMASIQVDDARAGSLMAQILSHSGIALADENRSADATIWILSPTAQRLATTVEWRARHPRGHLLLMHPAPAERAAEWASLHPQVIDDPHDFERIRLALSQALAVDTKEHSA